MTTTTAVRVTVVPDAIALGPGEAADLEITVQNASEVVEHFTAALVGLPADVFTREPATPLMLRPRESGTVRGRIAIPAQAGPVAGRYVLGILVTSPYQRSVSRCEEVVLDLHAVPVLTATVRPEIATGGATGDFAVTVANEGNVPLAVTLTGDDPENRVDFAFEPRQLRLPPGTAANSRLLVHADRPLTGQEVRRNLTLHAHADGLTVDKQLSFVQSPAIGGGWLKAAKLAGAAAALAGITVAGAVLIRGAKQQTAHPALPTAALSSALSSQLSSGASQKASPSGTVPGSAASPSASGIGAPAPGGAVLVDFSRTADGQADGDQIITGDAYAAKTGVKLSVDTSNAPPACTDATALALRTRPAEGGFLTSARPAGVDLCNQLPVRMDFAAPAASVTVRAFGDGAAYALTVTLSDGSTDRRTVPMPAGAATPIAYQAPAGAGIVSVVYGHADPAQTAKDPTIIKSLSYVAAAPAS